MTEEWKPKPSDMIWLRELVRRIKIGGMWIMPTWGIQVQKVGKRKLSILKDRRQPITPQYATCSTEEVIRRTIIVAELAGIEVVEEEH